MEFSNYQQYLIWATRSLVAPNYRNYPAGTGGFSTAWYLESGGVELEYGQKRVRARTGQWLLRGSAKGFQHFEPDTRLISIRFGLRLRGGAPVFHLKADHVVDGGPAKALTGLAWELVGLCTGYTDADGRYLKRSDIPIIRQLSIDGVFLSWLSEYGRLLSKRGEEPRVADGVDPRVQRALEIIEEFPQGRVFSEQALAQQCGLSVNHLNLLFQQVMSITPCMYFNRLRARRARHALEETLQPIKGIAYDLGFSSPAHFTTWFRRQQGVAPRDYRRESTLQPQPPARVDVKTP